jgi:hypothetical protein
MNILHPGMYLLFGIFKRSVPLKNISPLMILQGLNQAQHGKALTLLRSRSPTSTMVSPGATL